MGHLIDAINAAYDEDETRGFLRRRGMALALTLGAIVFLVLSFVGVALLPAIVAGTSLGSPGRIAVGVIRWVLLLALGIVGLAVLYRHGPDRDDARWRWVSPGAILATALWLVASIGFSIYTANFGKYNETYGALGAVVVVMLWLFITAVARDAYAADTVGETADEATRREDEWSPPRGRRSAPPSAR